MMKKDTVLILWAWLKEPLLVLIVYCLLLFHFGNVKILNMIYEHWRVLATIGGIIFGISVAILICYHQALDSEFGKYLVWRKVDKQYTRVFQFQAILPFLMVCVALTVFFEIKALGHIIWIMFLYTCVNGITVIRNICDLYHLKQKFNIENDNLHLNSKTDKI